MNDKSSKKKKNQSILFSPAIFAFPLLELYLNLLRHSNTLVLDKHSPLYALFNISNVSVAIFFNSTQNLIAELCSILKLQHDKKINFTKTTEILMCLNQTT
jgi:hypothetical protein